MHHVTSSVLPTTAPTGGQGTENSRPSSFVDFISHEVLPTSSHTRLIPSKVSLPHGVSSTTLHGMQSSPTSSHTRLNPSKVATTLQVMQSSSSGLKVQHDIDYDIDYDINQPSKRSKSSEPPGQSPSRPLSQRCPWRCRCPPASARARR